MHPVSPVIPNQNMPEIIVAEHQDEYQNLPAIALEGGVILCRWKLDEEERARVAETGDIYVFQWTGGGAVTPMLLKTEPPKITVQESVQRSVQMMTAPRWTAAMVKKAAELGFPTFEGNCFECRERVIFTDSTKETLSNSPGLKIICSVCFKEKQKENPELSGVFLPNTADEYQKIVEYFDK